MKLLRFWALALWLACAASPAASAADISWRGANTAALDAYARLHWIEWNGSAWVWKPGFDASVLIPFTVAASASVDVSAYDPVTGSYPLWVGGVVPGAGDIARLVWSSDQSTLAQVGGNTVVSANVVIDGAFAPDHIVLGPDTFQRVRRDLVVAKPLVIQTLNSARGFTTATQPDIIVNDGFSLTLSGENPLTFQGARGGWEAINLNGANAALRFNAAVQTLTPPPTGYVHGTNGIYGGRPLSGSGPLEFPLAGAAISLAHPGTRVSWTDSMRTIAMPAIPLGSQSLRVRSDQTWTSPTRTGQIMRYSVSGQPLFESIDGGALTQFDVPFSVRTADSTHTFTLPAGTYQSIHTHRSSDTQRASTMRLLGNVTLTGGTVIPGSGGTEASEGTYSLFCEGTRRMSQYLDLNGFSLTTARGIHVYHDVQDRTAADERTRILAAGATLDIGGDLVIASVVHPAGTVTTGVLDETRGMGVFGDAATALTLRGDFLSNVRSPTGSGLYLSTVNLVGGTMTNPSGFLTNSFEVGADPADLITTGTYAIGTLNVGTPATAGFIRLVNASINDGDPGNLAKTGAGEVLLAGTLNIDSNSVLDLNGQGAKVVTALTIDATGRLDLNTGLALADGTRVERFQGVGDQTAAWTACADRVIDSSNPGVAFAPGLDGGDTFWVAQLPDAITWTGAISNDWSDAGNWNPAVVPGAGDLVRIGPDGPVRTTVTLSAPITVARIEFADADMTIDGAQTLTLNGGIAIGSGNAYHIACPVALGQPQTWDTGIGSLQSTGTISGDHTLTKAGTGTWTASAANTFSDSLIISAGTLVADHANATGATASVVAVLQDASLELTTVTISGQSLYLIGSGVGGAGALRTAGSGIWDGPVVLSGATTLGGTGSGTISGAISGDFTLSKAHSGSWTLSGNSAGWSGNLDFVDGGSGRIIAAHNNALGSTGSVTVSAGNSLELAAVSIPVGKTLGLAGDGGGAGALIATGAGNVWTGPVTLTAAAAIGGSGSGTLDAVCAGNRVLTKVGAGLWILSRANVFSGVVVDAGTLRATHLDALGNVDATPVSVNAATLEIAGITMTRPAFTLANGATVRGIGTAGFTRNLIVVTGGTATLGYSSASDVFTLAGVFATAGQGSLVIAGDAGMVGGKVVFTGSSPNWINGSLSVQPYATLELVASTSPYYPMGANGGTGNVTIAEGATLRVRCAHTTGAAVHRDFAIGGDGVDGLGALIGINNGLPTRFIAMYGNMVLTADTSLGGVDNTSAIRGNISGAFDLTQRGPGSWELSGVNAAWPGDIVVVGGTLVANTAPSSSTSVLGDATGTTTVQDGATLQFVGNFTSPEPVTVAGSGVGGLGALQGPSGAGSTTPILSGPVTLAGATTMATTSTDASARLSITGTITGSHGITIGAGDVQFDADNSASFTGNIIIAGGRLLMGHVNALGDAVGTTTISNGARLWIRSVIVGTDIHEPLIMQGAGGGAGQAALNIDKATINWYGNVLLAGHATISLTRDNIHIHGVISDGGNGYALTKIGTNPATPTCSLRSANTYSGGTFVNQGILRIVHAQALGSGTATVASGATLRINLSGNADIANHLVLSGTGHSSAGALSVEGTSGVITTMPAGTSITLAASATIKISTGNSLYLDGQLAGSSLLTLTADNSNDCWLRFAGDNSAFTGAMTISGARVIARHANALGDASGTVTVTNTNFGALYLEDASLPVGKPLSLSGTGGDNWGVLRVIGTAAWNGPVTLAAASTLGGAGTGSLNGVISGNVTLSKRATGTWILAGDNAGWTGNIAFFDGSSGRLVAAHDNALGTGGSVTVTSGDILELAGAAIPAGKSLVLNGNGGSATTGALIATGAGNAWNGSITLGSATTIGGTGSGVLGGTLSGAFNLTKCSAGTWTLAGNNGGYANVIAFQDGSSGRFVAAHANALGSNASLAVPAGCSLELAGADVPAGKTLTLAGDGGGATVGALIATGAGNGWGGNVVLSAASTIGGTGAGIIRGTLSGGFALTKCSSGAWTLAGNNSGYASTIAFQDGSSGRLIAAHANALGTAAALTVPSGCALELDGASVPAGKSLTLSGTGDDGTGGLVATNSCAWGGDLTLGAAATLGGTGSGTISGAISGAFALTKAGAGAWTLDGTNTFTTLTVDAGILAIAGTAGSGDVTVNAGGTLAGTGAIAGAVVLAGGSLSPGSAAGGIGTLTLGGALTGTGALVVALSGASADRVHTTAGASPVTLTGIDLSLSGLPTATATILSFPNATHATTFNGVTGLHPSCTGPTYLTNSVVIEPATLDLVFTGNCTGSGTAINRIWPLGTIEPGRTVSSESGRFAQVFELENKSTFAVEVNVTASAALRSIGGNIDWTIGVTGDTDQFRLELKPDGGAWADLAAAQALASGLAIDAAKAFDLRFTAPTASTHPSQKTITVTATASIAP